MPKVLSVTKFIKISKLLGSVATIISIIFLAIKLSKQIHSFKTLSFNDITYTVTLMTLVPIIVLMSSSFAWMKLLSIFNIQKCSWKSLNLIYIKSNLLKYIPGNIFQFVGRNQLAIDYPISHGDVILSTVLEIICIICSAILFFIVLSSRFVFTLARQYASGLICPILIIICIFAALIIVIGKIFWHKLSQYISSRVDVLKKVNTWQTMCCVMGIYLLIFGIQGSTFILVICVHSPSTIPILQIPSLMAAYTFSWLLSFITPGSPAGLGIRELTLFSFLSQFGFSEEMFPLFILIPRIGNTLGDIFAYIIALAIKHTHKEGENI